MQLYSNQDMYYTMEMKSAPFIMKPWSSPHGTLDPHPMRIGDPDSKTTLPPHSLDPDPRCVLCYVTVREMQ